MSHRIVYSLQFELEPLPESKPDESTCLVVPLDRAGMAAVVGSNGQPRPPILRTIDLRVGDQLLCGKRWRTIKSVEAYRDMLLTEAQAAASSDRSGYLYAARRDGAKGQLA